MAHNKESQTKCSSKLTRTNHMLWLLRNRIFLSYLLIAEVVVVNTVDVLGCDVVSVEVAAASLKL